MRKLVFTVIASLTLTGTGMTEAARAQQADMTFFVTSVGLGKGADLGGLAGADAHCTALAKSAGARAATWRAYLSTTPTTDRSSTPPTSVAGVDARSRIGKGPWKNAKGVVVAKSVEDLHSANANLTKETLVNEKGGIVNGRTEKPNMHDILTGSDPSGMYSTAGGDTTCGNWTKSAEGSAIVGHHDRVGLNPQRHSLSWNSAHGSRGCSQDNLRASGGAGLFYCFAAD